MSSTVAADFRLGVRFLLGRDLASPSDSAVDQELSPSSTTGPLFWALCLISLSTLQAYVGLARSDVEPERMAFNFFGLQGQALWILALAVLAWLAYGPKLALNRALIACFAGGFILDVVNTLLHETPNWVALTPAENRWLDLGLRYFLPLVLSFAAYRLVRRCASLRKGLFAFVWTLSTSLMMLRYPGVDLLYDARPREVVTQDSLAVEETQVIQTGLLSKALNGIAAHRSGVPELYFVGFAPDGTEAVFMRELAVIRPLMDQRFDTQDRSIQLQNHPSTLRLYPAATTTHLNAALQAIGQRIDAREDVLVLYLTSHGSRKHELMPNAPPMQLTSLNARSLKTMLDAAGIRLRVIIVSACFSGGFIEPLKDEQTIVLTASDAKQPSFGCSNESDFTYFGRALFNEALRSSYSFEDAFKLAQPVIRQRELQMGFEPSNPQAHFGTEVLQTLKRIEARLQAKKN
jgi:Peptidase C13 family